MVRPEDVGERLECLSVHLQRFVGPPELLEHDADVVLAVLFAAVFVRSA